MIALADRFHLVAPDYPGFGFSDFPDKREFKYTFKNISLYMEKFVEKIGLDSFTIYLHDYGAPVGLRLCLNHPGKIKKIIVQNGNAYEEGVIPQWDEVREYWKNPTEEKKKKIYAFISEEGTKMQYTVGLSKDLLTRVSPESWIIDWHQMKRPGNAEMQFELNCNYENHIEMFPVFQQYFRDHQPETLVIWGKNDPFLTRKKRFVTKRPTPSSSSSYRGKPHDS